MPIQQSLRRASRGALLLAACALAACGREDAREPAAEGEAAKATQAAAAPATGPGSACTPPPAVPDTLFAEGKSWDRVTTFIEQQGIEFDTENVGEGDVKLCPGCKAVGTRVQSAKGVECLSEAALSGGELYLVGLVTTDSIPQANRAVFGPGNLGNQVYLLVGRNATHAMYEQAGKRIAYVRRGPRVGWRFTYCQEQHPELGTDTVPRAAWRPYDTGCPEQGQPRQQPRAPAARDAGDTTVLIDPTDPTDLAYGWMACANGCCRFYGSPPGGMGEPNPGQGYVNPGQGNPNPGQGNPNPGQGGQKNPGR